MVSSQFHYTKRNRFMPFLLAEILNFQGSTHQYGVGSFSQLFIKYKVTVDFGDEYVKENSPYHVIFCKIRKRDEKKFLDALSEMYDKMLLMGYKDYQEVCDNFIRVVEQNEKEK